MTLSEVHQTRLTRALVLRRIAPTALSDFESETLDELDRRRRAFGCAAATTAPELAVPNAAVEALEAWVRTNVDSLVAGATPATLRVAA